MVQVIFLPYALCSQSVYVAAAQSASGQPLSFAVLRVPADPWHSSAYRVAFCKIEAVLKVALKLSITITPAAKLSSDQKNIICVV